MEAGKERWWYNFVLQKVYIMQKKGINVQKANYETGKYVFSSEKKLFTIF